MEVEISDKIPLTPGGKIHPRSDEYVIGMEEAPKMKYRGGARSQQGNSGTCFVYVFLFIVLLSAAALIFSIAVLRVDRPHVKLSSVTVGRLNYVAASPVSFNATLFFLLAVDNNNFGRYRFGESSATVGYHNWTIGGGRIVGGRARARETERFNISMNVKSAEGLSNNQNFSSDLSSGTVNLNSYAELSGRVRIMKIVNKFKKTVMNCTMNLHLHNRVVHDLLCL